VELSEEAPGLLGWVLYVAGIAALDSDEQIFFESALRGALVREELEDWTAAGNTLGGFLWSQNTCGPSAAMLWEAVSMTCGSM